MLNFPEIVKSCLYLILIALININTSIRIDSSQAWLILFNVILTVYEPVDSTRRTVRRTQACENKLKSSAHRPKWRLSKFHPCVISVPNQVGENLQINSFNLLLHHPFTYMTISCLHQLFFVYFIIFIPFLSFLSLFNSFRFNRRLRFD